MRLIDVDALDVAFTALRWRGDELLHWGDRPNWCLIGEEVEKLIADAPTIDAIPVEYLMKYAQLPTEFAIAAWRKQDKDDQEKRIKRLDKPMPFDDALNLVNDVFPLGQNEQEAR